MKDKLYVIAVIYNPCKYQSRYKLYFDFEKYIKKSGAILYTTELSYDGDFVVTDKNNKRHTQLHSKDVLWHKENLINITLKKLPKSCKYVAWIDADVHFDNENWVQDTIDKLQKHSVIQLFHDSVFLNKDGSSSYRLGFSYSNVYKDPFKKILPGIETLKRNQLLKENKLRAKRGGYTAPGLAWAARKDFLDYTDGLIEKIPFHTGDEMVANALYERPVREDHASHQKIITLYTKKAFEYYEKTKMYPSFLDNTIVYHNWHGSAKNRDYYKQTQYFQKYNLDVDKDIIENEYGVYELAEHVPQEFKEEIKNHFTSRKEDE
jgi:hypothetical protein